MNYCKDCKKAKSKGQIWYCGKHRQFITVFTTAYLKDKQCPDYEKSITANMRPWMRGTDRDSYQPDGHTAKVVAVDLMTALMKRSELLKDSKGG